MSKFGPIPTILLAFMVGCSLGDGVDDRESAAGPAGTTSDHQVDRPLFEDLERFAAFPSEPRASASSEFWQWWGDGRAELSGYRMTIGRYGAAREAELTLIYVTEPHDRGTWIKDDDAGGANRVEVLKLNQNVEFMTGIYPYSVMTSVFTPVDRYGSERFQPVRLTHAVQEWCGAYSHLLWPGEERFRSLRLSYFAHEGERVTEVATGPNTVYEDALLIQLRELDGPFAEGGDWDGLLVPELWRFRASDQGTDPLPATISRANADRDHDGAMVPVTRFVLRAGDYERTYDVERDHPRRILGWTTSTGDTARLIDTERLAYWNLNRLGDESYREAIGLSPLGSIPPGSADGPAGGCPQ